MTAENRRSTRFGRTCAVCFNEAAADDRGKLARVAAARMNGLDASMRPRPMTAENMRSRHSTCSTCFASMRPRPMTAENGHHIHGVRRLPRRASMRPRPMTAENINQPRRENRVRRGFNEAAADDRGKQPGPVTGPRLQEASMRPRPMTAENRGRAAAGLLRDRASMRPRPMTAENDGPARPGHHAAAASMRPRPMTAENGEERQRPRPPRPEASMRPRPMTAENTQVRGQPRTGAARFNEAAADDRGKPRLGFHVPRPRSRLQ